MKKEKFVKVVFLVNNKPDGYWLSKGTDKEIRDLKRCLDMIIRTSKVWGDSKFKK